MNTGRFPLSEFQEISRLNPFWSSWICFSEVMREKNSLSKRTVKKYFGKLIDKNDYAKSDERELLTYLYQLKEEPQ